MTNSELIRKNSKKTDYTGKESLRENVDIIRNNWKETQKNYDIGGLMDEISESTQSIGNRYNSLKGSAYTDGTSRKMQDESGYILSRIDKAKRYLNNSDYDDDTKNRLAKTLEEYSKYNNDIKSSLTYREDFAQNPSRLMDVANAVANEASQRTNWQTRPYWNASEEADYNGLTAAREAANPETYFNQIEALRIRNDITPEQYQAELTKLESGYNSAKDTVAMMENARNETHYGNMSIEELRKSIEESSKAISELEKQTNEDFFSSPEYFNEYSSEKIDKMSYQRKLEREGVHIDNSEAISAEREKLNTLNQYLQWKLINTDISNVPKDLIPMKEKLDKDYQLALEMEEKEKAFKADWENKSDIERFGDWLGTNLYRGLTSFNRQLASTGRTVLDTLNMNPEGSLFDNIFDYYESIDNEESIRQNFINNSTGPVGKAVGEIITGTVNAMPAAILAVMSGGTSLTGSAAMAGNATTMQLVSSGLRSAAKSPSFWLTTAQTLGPEYEDAIENGATKDQAIVAAFISTTLNALVEVGGGIEKLPTTNKGIVEWLKSTSEEGIEEVVQDLISQTNAMAIYDQNKELFSMSNENALINPVRSAQNYMGGLAVGAVLGGGQVAIDKGRSKIIEKVYESTPTVEKYSKGEISELSKQNGVTVAQNVKSFTSYVEQSKKENSKPGDLYLGKANAKLNSGVEAVSGQNVKGHNIVMHSSVASSIESGKESVVYSAITMPDFVTVSNDSIFHAIKKAGDETVSVDMFLDDDGTVSIESVEIKIPVATKVNNLVKSMKSSKTSTMQYKGKTIEISSVESVEDGKMDLKLKDGTVVPMTEIEYANEDQKILYASAAQMPTKGAAYTMISSYTEGTPVAEYVESFRNIEGYGYNGIEENVAMEAARKTVLTPAQALSAYTVGKNAYDAYVEESSTVQKESAERKVAKEKGTKKGRVTYKFSNVKLSKKQRSSIEYVKLLSEITGINFELYESMVDSRGRRYGENGSYSAATNTIRLDIHSGNMSEQAVLRTLSHELTHYIKENNYKAYEQLQDYLLEKYRGLNEGAVARLVDIEKSKHKSAFGKELSDDKALEEVVANACEMMLKDSKAIQKLAEEDQTLFEAFKEAIANIIDRLRRLSKSAFTNVKGSSAEYAVLNEVLDDFTEIQNIWDNALTGAVRNSVMLDASKEETREYISNNYKEFDGILYAPDVAEVMDSSEYHKPVDYMDESLSVRTLPDWAKNYMEQNNVDETDRVVQAMRKFTDQMIQNDAIYNYVPNGEYKYNKLAPFRKNMEYKITFDMDTSCPRVFQFNALKGKIQKRGGRPLTYNESINLLELMRAYGQMIPCSYCYVENKRVLLSASYNNFFKFRDAVIRAKSDAEAEPLMYGYDAKKKTLSNASKPVFKRWRSDLEFNPSVEEVWVGCNTARNSILNFLDQEKEDGKIGKKTSQNKILSIVCNKFGITDKSAVSEVEDITSDWIYDTLSEKPHYYETINDKSVSEVNEKLLSLNREALSYAKSASSAKGVENYVPYTDQLKNISPEIKDYVIGMGGVRKHSSNDFRIDYVQDYFLLFADLAAGNWTGHTYTKNIDYVKIFGKTGDRINLSIAMEGNEYGSVRENINEGAAWNDAKWARKNYKNVGVMAMVTSDAQLSYALNSNWIDMIIPFHSSGLDKAVWYNLRMWEDYTSKQNEQFLNSEEMKAKLKEKGITVPSKANASEVFALYQKEFSIEVLYDDSGKRIKPHFFPNDTRVDGHIIPGHHNDAKRYFELCKKYGVHPRFDGVTVQDADGNEINVINHPQYIKLIKETARTDSEQETIKFNFDEYDPAIGMTPMEYAMNRMEEEANNGGFTNTASDPMGIVDEFMDEYFGKDREIGYLTERAKMTREILEEQRQEKEKKILEDEDLYQAEIDETVKEVESEQGTSYSIAEDRDGKKIVAIDTDQDLFAGKPTSYSLRDEEYLELAKDPEANREQLQSMVDQKAKYAFKNSKILDEEGNLLKVFHGSDSDFTVFDRTKTRANMDIQGSFFSPWELDAEGYGRNVRAFYLNITNPANSSVSYRALNKFKGENNAGIKARDLLVDMGYDGVNNDNEEYIAFNANQIKSADPVTYDDNGNVIPLSQRFNVNVEDVRYQVRDDWMPRHEHVYGDDLEHIRKVATERASQSGNDIDATTKWLYTSRKGKGLFAIYSTENYNEENGVPPTILYASGNTDKKSQADNEYAWFMERKKESEVINNDVPSQTVDTSLETVGNELRKDISSERRTGNGGSNYRNATVYSRPSGFRPSRALLSCLRNCGKTSERTDGVNETVDTTNDEQYQLRETSDRELLADALTSVAKTPEELDLLKSYKSNSARIDKLNAELSDVNSQIKEISFSKGKRDTTTLANLRARKTKLEADISRFDKRLLQLEASKPIKDILTREKTAAVKKAKAEMREISKEKVEQLNQKISDIKQHNREMNARKVESRRRTELKNKILKVKSNLDRMLMSPTDKNHVPRELISSVVGICEAITVDTNSKSLKEKLSTAKAAYDAIKQSEDYLVSGIWDEIVSDDIQYAIDSIGNTPINRMSLSQLQDVYDVLKTVRKTVSNANKSFVQARGQSIAERAEAVRSELVDNKERKNSRHKAARNAKNYANSSYFEMLKPVYAFREINSDTLTEAYENVRKGEDVYAVDVAEGQEVFQRLTKKYNITKNVLEKKHTLTTERGKEITLSTNELMTLYALMKRQQAAPHLMTGGFVFEEEGRTNSAVQITTDDAMAFAKELTDDEAGFADEMQKYLAEDMAAKGNEVSRTLYDVTKFKDPNYFPIKSASQYLVHEEKGKALADRKIKNAGFTKDTVKNANNPVSISEFTKVWAGHVDEMSMYHAFTLPLEDFNRIFNYNRRGNAEEGISADSVKMAIESTSGRAAVNYVNTLIQDLNGGVRGVGSGQTIDNMVGLFKKGAVFASASVVIQQPSAIARSMAVLNPKYLISGAVQSTKARVSNEQMFREGKRTWEEVKKYAPIARIKEMGYFDTGLGHPSAEWMTQFDYDGIWNKAAAMFKDGKYRDDVISSLPALADQLTWCAIWNGCKAESKAMGYAEGTQAYYEQAAKRFTEVIEKTQVYDSVFSRAQIMRRKDGLTKMATAFMAEPLTSFNMLSDATKGALSGRLPKSYAVRAIGAFVSTTLLNSILKSIVTAARDDDKDKHYLEKYLGDLVGNFMDDINPLNMIPMARDVVSIFSGWDVKRTDMTLVTNLKEAIDAMYSENKTWDAKFEEMAGAIAAFFGIPVKNVWRDLRAAYNVIEGWFNGTEFSGERAKEEILENFGYDTSDKAEYRRLYEATMDGDVEKYQAVRGLLSDKTDKQVESGIRSALVEYDERIAEAAKAKFDGDMSRYMELAKEVKADGFRQDTVIGAINNYTTKHLKPEDEDSGELDEDDNGSFYKSSDVVSSLESNDVSEANMMITDILSFEKDKKGEDKKRSSIRAAVTKKFKPLYKFAKDSGNTTEMNRIKNMLIDLDLGYTSKTFNSWAK